jgi:hypothetical protein
MDDSKPPALGVELQGIPDPVVASKVRTVEPSAVEPGSLASSCLREGNSDTSPVGLIVERVGVTSESVTLREASALHSCDNSPGRRERNLRWCTGAYGTLYDGRLRDPRLTIVCETSDRRPVGFAWMQPTDDTKYVAVHERDYTEVYEVAGGLPVRVATASGAMIEGSRASFELSEHDASGNLLRRYRLDAVVAG